jgi:uncharacterized membrane protein
MPTYTPLETSTHEREGRSQTRTQSSNSRRRTPIEKGGSTANRVAQGLGWFSIGLGVTELIAPGLIARIVGSRNHHFLIRTYGIREITAGIGILSTNRPGGWLWSRVAGDAIDLISIGRAAGSSRNSTGTTISALSVAGVTAVDVWCARQFCDPASADSKYSGRAEASLIVNKSPEECYAFWRDFEKLPRFMSHLESVTVTGGRTSHWVAMLPGNKRLEWDAELVNDTPNQRLVWQSLPGSDVPQSGSVEFERAHAGRGTIVRVSMDYGGAFAAGSVFASLIGKDPEQVMRKELHRFKQAIETGEVITTEGQPAGRRSGATWLDRIAR